MYKISIGLIKIRCYGLELQTTLLIQ